MARHHGLSKRAAVGCLVAATLLTGSAHAGKYEHKGEVTLKEFQLGECSIASLTGKYRFDVFMGEPTKNGAFQWEAGEGTAADCLSYKTVISFEVTSGTTKGWITLAPTVPKAGKGYGMNVTGSPDWDEFICGVGEEEKSCMSADDAKSFVKAGYEVTAMKVWQR